MRKVVMLGGAMAALTVAGSGQPALAACHSFTVAAAPAEVAEGGTVTVTVSRDAGVAPSQVDVSAVAESATPGEDTAGFSETATFPGGSTSQSFPLAVIDDSVVEGTETFRLHLSNPQGCAVNPNLQVGPDATVTIADNDAAAPATAPPITSPPTTTASSAPSTTLAVTTSTASTSSTTTTTAEASSTTGSSTPTTADFDGEAAPIAEDESGGGGSGTIVLLVAIAAVAGGVAYLVWRRSPGAHPRRQD